MPGRWAVATLALALTGGCALAGCGGSAPGMTGARSDAVAAVPGQVVNLVTPASNRDEAGAQPAPGDVVIPPAPAHFDGPAPAPAPPPAPLQAPLAAIPPSAGTWAVVIGINQYPGGTHNLQAAVADANDMTTALSMLDVPPDHILRLTDTQATAANIDASAEWLDAHAGPDAIATFFYAGHVRKLAPSTEAIVGSDGNLVTDTDLAARFSHLVARRAWFVIAGCYGGGFDELLAPGRILTAAADANHLAYENETLGRSYIDEFLIHQAIIEGKAAATVQSAFSYAYTAIAQQYPGREPVEYDDQAGPLDLRPQDGVTMAATPATSPAQPAPQPPQQPAPPAPQPQPQGQQPPATTSTTVDGCAQLTVGFVRCNP